MFSASSITLSLDGWTAAEDADHNWINSAGDVLSAHHFPIAPDLPAPLTELAAIRAYYRQMLGRAGAIVEVEAIEVRSLPALRTIVKIKQEPTGMTYVAAVTVPFSECSFVAKVQCPELGMTGLRDTVVATKLNLHGVAGWMADPYDPAYRNPILRNRSDDSEWDVVFPDHPLSRARRHLEQLARLGLPEAVEALAPFMGNRKERPRPSFLRRLFGGKHRES